MAKLHLKNVLSKVLSLFSVGSTMSVLAWCRDIDSIEDRPFLLMDKYLKEAKTYLPHVDYDEMRHGHIPENVRLIFLKMEPLLSNNKPMLLPL